MQVNPHIRKQLRIQHRIFLFLLLIIVVSIAWLSLHYDIESDWTQNKRNTPSETSLNVLTSAQDPVTIKAFVSAANDSEKRNLEKLVSGFHRYKSNIELEFIDPITQPGLTREHNIHGEGEVLIEYQGREEKLRYLDEQSLTNALQRLARNSQKWIAFLEGHGERTPYQQGNYDYGTLRQQLDNKGFKTRAINLAERPEISKDTAVLVIADIQSALLAGEMQVIQDYIDGGGNLFWLHEPASTVKIEELSEQIGIETLPGMIVDMNSQLMGIADPRFVMVPEYPVHAITRNFDTVSLFPTAAGLEVVETEDWEVSVLLESLTRSWIEMDEIGTDEITMDSGSDTPGPITLGLTLTRFAGTEIDTVEQDDKSAGPSELDDDEPEVLGGDEQRIVVIGDADFLADAYIGQGGNLDLAINIFNWLTRDDSFLNIPARTLIDQQLNLNPAEQIFIGLMFIALIPLGLIIAGIVIWLRRRKM